jgi:histidinol-phosphate aminotransferase
MLIRMAKVKEHIQKMNSYRPPLEGRTSKKYLLLDFNERTTSPDKKVKDAIKSFIDSNRLQVYPEYENLEARIAEYAKVPSSCVMATNGSNQGIDIVCRVHLDKGDKVIIPFPSFSMHYQSAYVQGSEVLGPAYKEDGKFPLEDVLDMLEDEKVRLVIICNPNNPLGTATPLSVVEKVLTKAKENGVAVLHDEAYFEFSGISAKALIEKYDNLYIVRTFSKAFGMPSIRAGYVISHKDNIQELLKVRGPYDVNMFAKVAVLAALDNTKYAEDYVKEVMEKSKPKVETFLREKGVSFYPSDANFLLLKIPKPKEAARLLKSKGILVRIQKNHAGREAMRVTIGSVEDINRFCRVFEEIIRICC